MFPLRYQQITALAGGAVPLTHRLSGRASMPSEKSVVVHRHCSICGLVAHRATCPDRTVFWLERKGPATPRSASNRSAPTSNVWRRAGLVLASTRGAHGAEIAPSVAQRLVSDERHAGPVGHVAARTPRSARSPEDKCSTFVPGRCAREGLCLGAEIADLSGFGWRRSLLLGGEDQPAVFDVATGAHRMIGIGAAAGISAITFSLAIAPGPNMVYLISRSLSQGPRAGLVSLLGVVSGFATYLVATVAGLTTLFMTVPSVLTIITTFGALYLLYLAWTMLRPGGRDIFVGDATDAHSARKLFLMGLTTCLLNPKVALMYMALLPQFVVPDQPTTPQLLQLGVVHILVSGSINAGWALSATPLAQLLKTRPRAQLIQRWCSGLLLGLIALQLLLTSA